MLAYVNGAKNIAVVELAPSPDGMFYSVISARPANRTCLEKRLIWEAPRGDASPAFGEPACFPLQSVTEPDRTDGSAASQIAPAEDRVGPSA
ncbi:hypothetical protein [Azospirillum sp. BE72]|uniref:hypothetical protein n=1 Tax=Azospirillum sp. BE72 TaxID=2817776 RepID=UPI002863B552|nr:hypothetical protein [Azospirillum sp. BE72]MDR6770398.1 hypothetical protein [Azospirillum sp. BE72]